MRLYATSDPSRGIRTATPLSTRQKCCGAYGRETVIVEYRYALEDFSVRRIREYQYLLRDVPDDRYTKYWEFPSRSQLSALFTSGAGLSMRTRFDWPGALKSWRVILIPSTDLSTVTPPEA